MGEIVDILAVLPLRHALVVMASFVLLADTVGVADEEGADLLLLAELDHLPGGLVAQIAHTTFNTTRHLVSGALELHPAAGVLLTTRLFPGKLAVPHVALAFEAANAAPGDDNSRTGVGGHGGQVDFSQVHRRAVLARGLLGLWYLDADVQFKAAIPDQGTGSAVLRQVQAQDQRGASPSHWEHHAPLLAAHRLRGPVNRIELFRLPGVLHAHLGMAGAEFACGFNVGKEGLHYHLHRLAVQGKASFGRPLQFRLSQPPAPFLPCFFM